jgi:chromosome segregation ATPase
MTTTIEIPNELKEDVELLKVEHLFSKNKEILKKKLEYFFDVYNLEMYNKIKQFYNKYEDGICCSSKSSISKKINLYNTVIIDMKEYINELKEKNERFEEFEDLEEKNKELENKNKELEERNKELEERNKELEEINKELEENKELEKLNKELEEKNKEIENYKELITKINNICLQPSKYGDFFSICEKKEEQIKEIIKLTNQVINHNN